MCGSTPTRSSPKANTNSTTSAWPSLSQKEQHLASQTTVIPSAASILLSLGFCPPLVAHSLFALCLTDFNFPFSDFQSSPYPPPSPFCSRIPVQRSHYAHACRQSRSLLGHLKIQVARSHPIRRRGDAPPLQRPQIGHRTATPCCRRTNRARRRLRHRSIIHYRSACVIRSGAR